jgi:hypothetical protein
MTLNKFLDLLDEHADRMGMDWGIELTCGREYMWAVELRITPKPNATNSPDVSTVFYRGCASSPQGAINEVAPTVISFVEGLKP